MSVMSPEELLEELARQRDRFESYAELEESLSSLMRQHHDQVSAHVSADDLLDYAAQRGLVRREGGELVVAPARVASPA
jgi:hypothetical protein